jgi:hypothetical protein
VVGSLEEACTIKFGEALTYLRNDARSIAAALEYETYATNVPLVYEENVYDRDEQGLIKFTSDGQGGTNFVILHAKGDPVLDDQMQPVIKHRVGDIKLDGDMEPITKGVRKLNRQFSIVLFDARYLFATDADTKAYKDGLASSIINYLNQDVKVVAKSLLERTELKFSPRKTMGEIEVTVKDGKSRTIPSTHSMTVDYYLTSAGYTDLNLRQAIGKSTNKTIAKILRKNTVSIQDIADTLKRDGGDEVVSVAVKGLGLDGDMEIFSLVESTSISSLASKLEVSTDGTIRLVDDVTINFIKHTS